MDSFGDSFIGTRLTISGKEWSIIRSYPGDSGDEEDCYLVLRATSGDEAEIHYQDYDEGTVLGQYPGDPLAGAEIDYPDGEPHSVTLRRAED